MSSLPKQGGRAGREGLGWQGTAGPDTLGAPLSTRVHFCAGCSQTTGEQGPGEQGRSFWKEGLASPPAVAKLPWVSCLPLCGGLLLEPGRESRQEVVSAFLECSPAPCCLPAIILSEGIGITLFTADSECTLGGIYECLGERKDTDISG